MDVLIAFFMGFMIGGGLLAVTLKQIFKWENEE